MIFNVTIVICVTVLLCTALVTGAWQKIRMAQYDAYKQAHAALANAQSPMAAFKN